MYLKGNGGLMCPITRKNLMMRQVQKSDQIYLDCQSRLDQLGSTRIISDYEKNIKLKDIETFKHLKVTIPVKNEAN